MTRRQTPEVESLRVSGGTQPKSELHPPEWRWRGLFVRRYRWGLSLGGKVVLSLFCLGLVAIFLLGAYPFLALTHRVNARVLVVEGWVHPYAITAALQEFHQGGYVKIYTTGGPVIGKGGYINDYNTAASVGADLLKRAGMPAADVQMVPTRVMGRDRTYSSAVALKNWFRDNNQRVPAINVLTQGTHARRSRFLFQEALGPETAVGVISVPDPDINARYWWRYSEGIQDVLEEALGYVYAKLFFYPSTAEQRWGSDHAVNKVYNRDGSRLAQVKQITLVFPSP